MDYRIEDILGIGDDYEEPDEIIEYEYEDIEEFLKN